MEIVFLFPNTKMKNEKRNSLCFFYLSNVKWKDEKTVCTRTDVPYPIMDAKWVETKYGKEIVVRSVKYFRFSHFTLDNHYEFLFLFSLFVLGNRKKISISFFSFFDISFAL